ncbi:MAG: 5'-methylthioadenosine/adenosylhomocysteine nucleosidase [Prevotella sp.]|nr:5'-methylthioadenosine/adenosylhomocysteine nucleosidase [Prevotella sp.]
MKIGTIVAMDKELVQLKSLLDNMTIERHHNNDFICGNIADKEIILQKCGIGKVNSAIGAVEMINNYVPDLIISTGVAGGADISMNVADVVVGSEYCYHDAYCGSECAAGQIIGLPPVFYASKDLVDVALSIEAGKNIHSGLIVSGDWFVDSQDKMRSILEKFPKAVAVDMESCSIAQVCHIYGVPFISFRIISDIPLKDKKASQYFDFWARIAEGSFNVTKNFIEKI